MEYLRLGMHIFDIFIRVEFNITIRRTSNNARFVE